MEPLFFFGGFLQKVIIFCIPDYFDQKTTQESDGSCNVTSGSQLLYKLAKKSPFFLQIHLKKILVSREYCFARHNDKMCFLTSCRYHIILMGDIKGLLQNLEAFCYNYQQVECLYTLFKYQFICKFVVKIGQLFEYVQRAVHFKHRNRGSGKNAWHRDNKFLRKKYRRLFELPPKDYVHAN